MASLNLAIPLDTFVIDVDGTGGRASQFFSSESIISPNIDNILVSISSECVAISDCTASKCFS